MGKQITPKSFCFLIYTTLQFKSFNLSNDYELKEEGSFSPWYETEIISIYKALFSVGLIKNLQNIKFDLHFGNIMQLIYSNS